MVPVCQWLNWLDSPDWQRWARATYGTAWQGRQSIVRSLLSTAAQRWGNEQPIALVRAPGRLNLMGRHIDHRGGFVHPIALPCEIWLALQPNANDQVTLEHERPTAFPTHSFRLLSVAPPQTMEADSWERWTRKEAQRRPPTIGWAVYAQAAAATMVNWHQKLGISTAKGWRGAKVLVTGDIPPEAGLSSSSALFVALLLALLWCNEATILHHPSRWLELAEICGYGEWFVGTRGGAGDHAAILLSRCGQITRIGFFPMTVAHLPFPEGMSLLVMDSGERAPKGSAARAEFNRRVAAYEVGMLLWHERFPTLTNRLRYLRDATPSRLGDESLVYQLLRVLPRYASFTELHQLLPSQTEQLERWREICQAQPDTALEVRGTCWFGVAECERSERFPIILEQGYGEQFGTLMTISHDGDRVSQWRNGQGAPFQFPTDDAALAAFEQHRVPLWKQGGSYRCSTPAIDFLVDTALGVGALGAQLSGAGLGGCAMALVRQEEVEPIAQAISKAYQNSFGTELAWFVAGPCQGAEILVAPPKA